MYVHMYCTIHTYVYTVYVCICTVVLYTCTVYVCICTVVLYTCTVYVCICTVVLYMCTVYVCICTVVLYTCTVYVYAVAVRLCFNLAHALCMRQFVNRMYVCITCTVLYWEWQVLQNVQWIYGINEQFGAYVDPVTLPHRSSSNQY